MGTMTNSEYPDEMIASGSALFAKKKLILGEKNKYFLEIINYMYVNTMEHPDLIVFSFVEYPIGLKG